MTYNHITMDELVYDRSFITIQGFPVAKIAALLDRYSEHRLIILSGFSEQDIQLFEYYLRYKKTRSSVTRKLF